VFSTDNGAQGERWSDYKGGSGPDGDLSGAFSNAVGTQVGVVKRVWLILMGVARRCGQCVWSKGCARSIRCDRVGVVVSGCGQVGVETRWVQLDATRSSGCGFVFSLLRF
jgi:hypothetical protein